MHTTALLVTFDTDTEITPEDRRALKASLAWATRLTFSTPAPVAVDHLDPSEPHVAALLPVMVE